MTCDRGLAERVRDYLQKRDDVVEKKMFGGLTFMVRDYMACGLTKDNFMVRVDKEKYLTCLQEPHASEMDFTGRALKGMLYIEPEGIEDDGELIKWLDRSLDFVDSLPTKIVK